MKIPHKGLHADVFAGCNPNAARIAILAAVTLLDGNPATPDNVVAALNKVASRDLSGRAIYNLLAYDWECLVAWAKSKGDIPCVQNWDVGSTYL